MKILIINGPNLNLLGQREPGIYGSESFDTYLPQLRAQFPDVQIDYYQSNVEGELISCACLGVICGFGLDSYRLAVAALVK